MRGWVYIMSNEAMPNLIKIGFSMKDPKMRAAELNGTWLPFDFIIEYEAFVENPQTVEQYIHRNLSEYCANKEFFRCPLDIAIAEIRKVVGRDILIENSIKVQETPKNAKFETTYLRCPHCGYLCSIVGSKEDKMSPQKIQCTMCAKLFAASERGVIKS